MTVSHAAWPNYMGGGTHGGNWNATAQAQSNSLAAAYSSLLGAAPGAVIPIPPGGFTQRTIDTASIEDAGICAGEIIGWRAWTVSDGRLRSMFVGTTWVPGEPMQGDPGNTNTGVHAFKERKRAVHTYGYLTDVVAIGRVALWGEVIEHEMGYRAEFGQVESLDEIIGGTQEQLDALRALYLANQTPNAGDRTGGPTGGTPS